MSFFDVLGGAVTGALDFVIEKNKLQAQLNRLRLVMRHESQTIDNAYIALGKHYYENMRDTDNTENKKLCATIDKSKATMKRAQDCCRTLSAQSKACYYDSLKKDKATADIFGDDEDITVCCSYDDESDSEPAQKDEQPPVAKPQSPAATKKTESK